MSFCSYEEAWGAPYDSNQKNDHVTKNDNGEQKVKNQVLQYNSDVQENSGMVDVAPLRGSLLGGAIPEEQWDTNEPQPTYVLDHDESDTVSKLEKSFDQKIDQLINTLEKFSKNNSKSNQIQQTTWTDVIIFISLGIAAIFVLDMFFKFGKWIVSSQMNTNIPQQISQQIPQPVPQQIPQPVPQQIPVRQPSIPEPQRYTYSTAPPQMYNYRGNVPYYPQPSVAPPPRGI